MITGSTMSSTNDALALLVAAGDPKVTEQRLLELAKAKDEVSKTYEAIREAQHKVDVSEKALKEKVIELDNKQLSFKQYEDETKTRLTKLDSDLNARDSALRIAESSAEVKLRDLSSKEEIHNQREAQLNSRDHHLVEREKNISQREKVCSDLEEKHSKRLEALKSIINV